MSRKINVDLGGVQTVEDLESLIDDGALSEEDVIYLFNRNKLPRSVMQQIDQRANESRAANAPRSLEERLRNVRYTGDVGGATADDIIDDDSDVGAGEDVSKDYEDMTVKELQAALTARELPTSGKHDELVARLRDDDEQRL